MMTNFIQTSPPTTVCAAFKPALITLALERLRPHRPLPVSTLTGKKYLQVLASIATVGLVEPLVVIDDVSRPECFVVLDGRLRLEALRRLGKVDALCLISTDDETYTYNRQVNHLSPAQDARMIAEAIRKGVSPARIATVLGVVPRTVQSKAALLEGICKEAAELLADKMCPASVYVTLKWLKPIRQIEAAELMCNQGNFTSAFAKAIRSTTPVEQLTVREPLKRRTNREITLQVAKLEREIATMQATHSAVEETYSVEHLELAASAAYIVKLMGNDAVSDWLRSHYAEYWSQLTAVADEARGAQKAKALA
ncbi:plasmid partitioning protein RepB C-terminal domain-containing protein [Paraburkholderia sp. RL17-380-BIE-A]|uniref:plasmid partitioning protein RepB C-terminal domain-containing protein n=1 Tax=Paraburkholderia sp. RL17-380-BIE-A TaxID=3031630 RepID=UPI0038BA55FB